MLHPVEGILWHVPSSGLLPIRLEFLPLEDIDDRTDVVWLFGTRHLQAFLVIL